jgi:hypothetical protein
MSPLELRLTDPVEALVVEQALALVRQLRQTCADAPHGQVLALAETQAVSAGRELSRRALEAVLNDLPCPAEKKGALTGPALVAKPAARARARRSARS